MNELERGLLEKFLDMYLSDLSSMVGEYLSLDRFANRPEDVVQVGKLWLDGFTIGLFVGIRGAQGEESEISEEDMETISRMIENRESEVAEKLLR